MSNPEFAKKVYSLQNAIVRELNDAHIFLQQVTPLLEDSREQYAGSRSRKDKRYYVPSTKKGKYAERTDKELKAIFDRYLDIGLYEAFLVNLVARFEWFLADVLQEFFSRYPLRITESFQGIPPCGKIDFKTLLETTDKSDLVRKFIAEHVGNVFRQRPSVYMGYLARILGIKEDNCFAYLYEISATRDLVVHNSRRVNQLYIDKAGEKARAQLGESILVDDEYFEECIANLKRVSGAIKRDIEKSYGSRKKKA